MKDGGQGIAARLEDATLRLAACAASERDAVRRRMRRGRANGRGANVVIAELLSHRRRTVGWRRIPRSTTRPPARHGPCAGEAADEEPTGRAASTTCRPSTSGRPGRLRSTPDASPCGRANVSLDARIWVSCPGETTCGRHPLFRKGLPRREPSVCHDETTRVPATRERGRPDHGRCVRRRRRTTRRRGCSRCSKKPANSVPAPMPAVRLPASDRQHDGPTRKPEDGAQMDPITIADPEQMARGS